jgi:hypothetical protein
MPNLQQILSAEAAHGSRQLRTLIAEFSKTLERLPAFSSEVEQWLESPDIDHLDLASRLEGPLAIATDLLLSYDLLPPAVRSSQAVDEFMSIAKTTSSTRTIARLKAEFDQLPKQIMKDPVLNEIATRGLVDNLDGTISDSISGLMWKKKSEGKFNWPEAMSLASPKMPHLFAGFSDWRVPTLAELKSLLGGDAQSFSEAAFPGSIEWYWSSTEFSPTAAWYVLVGTGAVNHAIKLDHRYEVRLVRIDKQIQRPRKR